MDAVEQICTGHIKQRKMAKAEGLCDKRFAVLTKSQEMDEAA
jgi:hypothetical protein